ncbi:MAG: FHA domain-containing protein [Phototrophicaceae bacterium]
MSATNEFPAVVVVDGEMASHNWILEKEEMVLGRDDTCDMVIPMRQVSRQHVVFRRVGDEQYEVEDLGSKNGTWLNGNRFEGTRQISDGDEVHLALKVRLRFVGSGITAPVTGTIPDVIPSMGGKGRMKIDLESRQLFINGMELDPPLSLPQYRLLELLFVNHGGVVSREEVVETVWPEAMGEGVSEQAIDALVRRLRDRLSEADAETQYVVTVRGHGFRLDNPTG